jgi:hypothetical protein
MAASAPVGHSILERPTSPSDCQREYAAAQSQRAESAGAQRDQLGSAIGAGLHTNR